MNSTQLRQPTAPKEETASAPAQTEETPKASKAQFLQNFKREEKRLRIELDKETVVMFFMPSGSAEYIQAGKLAESFVTMCQSDRCPADWKPFVPAEETTISQCFWISKFCEDVIVDGKPIEKMTQKDWLEMGKTSLLVPFLYKQLAAEMGAGIAAQEAEDLDALKNA